MELLERYLQAIGEFLPAEMKTDTLAELRANLLAEMDERAESLDREMNEGDVAAILKAHGKPQVVALRYLPQRSLIGPTVFPFYLLTLKRVMPLVVFVSFLARGIEFATSQRESVAQALVGFGLGLVSSLLITLALLTAVFAGIEWWTSQEKVRVKWNEWDPFKLPALKTTAEPAWMPKDDVKRVIDLVVHCLWMAYVLWVPWHPFWIIGPGVFFLDKLGVGLAPIWHSFYVVLVVVLVLQLVVKLAAFVPAMQAKLKVMKAVTDTLALFALGMLAWHSVYFVAASASADLAQIAEVNHAVGLALRVALVVAVAGYLKEAWKYAKRSGPMRQLAF